MRKSGQYFCEIWSGSAIRYFSDESRCAVISLKILLPTLVIKRGQKKPQRTRRHECGNFLLLHVQRDGGGAGRTRRDRSRDREDGTCSKHSKLSKHALSYSVSLPIPVWIHTMLPQLVVLLLLQPKHAAVRDSGERAVAHGCGSRIR